MVKTTYATLGRLAPALLLFSCVPPKAMVVQEAPAPVQAPANPDAATPAVAEPAAPTKRDDGPRLPDMLGMPGEGEFHSSAPTSPGAEPGAVIARPPTEPPPRRKPQAGE